MREKEKEKERDREIQSIRWPQYGLTYFLPLQNGTAQNGCRWVVGNGDGGTGRRRRRGPGGEHLKKGGGERERRGVIMGEMAMDGW